MRLVLSAFALFATTLPALAQDIDFGDDASQWANDGQCDDMRFQGEAMTPTILLDADMGHDATDCRDAYAAGMLSLVEGAGQMAPVPLTPEETLAPEKPATAADSATGSTGGTGGLGGGKGGKLGAGDGTPPPPQPSVVIFDGLNFGDDSGEWTNDGECDDRRFYGAGMAMGPSWANLGKDASDCVAAYKQGTVRLWNMQEALDATSCKAIDFGDDSGEYPQDGECDDPRFEGRGVAMQLSSEAIGRDATDCRQLCEFDVLGLRDYDPTGN